MIDGSGTTLWTQFSPDEAIEKKKVILDSGFPQNIEYDYDPRANLDSIVYPSGNKVFIPRNNANAINQIKRSYNNGPESFLLDQIQYNAALLPSLLDFSNGVNYNIAPDPGRSHRKNIKPTVSPQIILAVLPFLASMPESLN
jgi:hypothetical protein